MWSLWSHFRNPIFPYANVWFKSPWWGEYEVVARLYGPHSFLEWLRFPFLMIAPRQFYVTEVSYTDARMATIYAAALLAGVAWLVERVTVRGGRGHDTPVVVSGSRTTWRLVAVFWLLSFVIWTAQYSIYRYIVPLELLSGALLVALLRHLFRPGVAWPAIVLIAIALVASTRPPDWWRVDFGRRWFDVKVPYVEPHALVLLASDSPMAYVLPFFPPDARNLGINNSISDPARETLMEREIERAIREHKGPLYSLSFPAGKGAEALAAHGLRRLQDTCADVRTNMLTSPIELCRLARVAE
jgi:hypothetical protein